MDVERRVDAGHHRNFVGAELVIEVDETRGRRLADGQRETQVLDREVLHRALHLGGDRGIMGGGASDRGRRAFVEVGVHPRSSAKDMEEGAHGNDVMAVRMPKNDDVVRVERYAGCRMPSGEAMEEASIHGAKQHRVEDVDHNREEHG